MASDSREPTLPAPGRASGAITHRTYARVGLFGNPSDQYGGRTIAFSLENFYATVTLTPAPTIRFVPHPEYDSTECATLDELVARVSGVGLYGGVRLLMATCKVFAEHCAAARVPLAPPPGGPPGFALSYDSTVPRQTGLAGSSAIVHSALRCLMDWYGVAAAIPPAARPGLVLRVEAGELGVAAGLQDRVVQVYGGAVHMDFDPAHMATATHGSGRYSRLDASLLPPLHVMWSDNPSESGKVHSGVKARWMAGDPQVRSLMDRVAACGDTGLRLLRQPPDTPGRAGALVAALNENFDLRRALFGDAVLGGRNLRMVELARSVGAGVNFSGSGGAAVVYCPAGEAQAAALVAAGAAEGFRLAPARVAPPAEELPPLPPPPPPAAVARAVATAAAQ